MIYILSAVFVIVAFFAGMFVYRLGMSDGMQRNNGAVMLDPLFEKKEAPEPDEHKELMDAVENYHGMIER